MIDNLITPQPIKDVETSLLQTYRNDGQISQVIETINDFAGGLLFTRETDWKYYDDVDGNPIDTINVIETDSSGNQTGWQITKHFCDDTQPISFTDYNTWKLWQEDNNILSKSLLKSPNIINPEPMGR